MPNKLTGGTAVAGGFKSPGEGTAKFGTGKVTYEKSNTIARTDTSAKDLFTIPARADIREVLIYGAAASNAGTTATVSVGKTGANTHYVNAYDVKTAGTGAGLQHPVATNMGSVGASEITVTGIYAESGTGSSAGGPWTVTIVYSIENV